MGDIIFSIVDQVNHGIDGSLICSLELRLDFAHLNEMAGVKAMECADYAAAGLYLNTALSLLPTDRWTNPTHYDQTRRLHFLLAKSAYSSGDLDKAQDILQEILREAHCLMDKLDSFYLNCLILYDRGAFEKAYLAVHSVLLQLGESIPSDFSLLKAKTMVETTAKTLSGFSEESLLGMKNAEKKTQYIVQFYLLCSFSALLFKSNMFPFFSCRLVELTRDSGKICKYSLIGELVCRIVYLCRPALCFLVLAALHTILMRLIWVMASHKFRACPVCFSGLRPWRFVRCERIL